MTWGEPTRRRNDFLAELNFKRNDLESSQPEGETIFKRNWPIGEFTQGEPTHRLSPSPTPPFFVGDRKSPAFL